jgi:ABC-type multidrug transport system fused ATPase/permease subunit
VKYLGGLIGFSVAAFLPYFGQNYIMTKIEDEITHTLRKKVFSKLMVMPVQWHERPEN